MFSTSGKDEDTQGNALIGSILIGAIFCIIFTGVVFFRHPNSPINPENAFRENCLKHGYKYNVDVDVKGMKMILTSTCEVTRK